MKLKGKTMIYALGIAAGATAAAIYALKGKPLNKKVKNINDSFAKIRKKATATSHRYV